jgi:hypothetical protein
VIYRRKSFATPALAHQNLLATGRFLPSLSPQTLFKTTLRDNAPCSFLGASVFQGMHARRRAALHARHGTGANDGLETSIRGGSAESTRVLAALE